MWGTNQTEKLKVNIFTQKTWFKKHLVTENIISPSEM